MNCRYTFFILMVFCLACEPYQQTDDPTNYYLPFNPVLVFSSSTPENTATYLDQIPFLGLKMNHKKTITNLISTCDFENLNIGLYKQDSSSFVLSGKVIPNSDSLTLSTSASKVVRWQEQGVNLPLFKTVKDDYLIISNDSSLISQGSTFRSTLLNRLEKVERTPASFELHLQQHSVFFPISLAQTADSILNKDAELSLHIKSNQNSFSFSGLALPDSILLQQLYTPKPSKLIEVIPSASRAWQVLVRAYNEQAEGTERFAKDSLPPITDLIEEIGSFDINGEGVTVLKLTDTYNFTDELVLDPMEVYREVPIYENPWEPGQFSGYNGLVPLNENDYLVTFETFLLFSNSLSTLRTTIASYLNERSVSNSQKYKDLSQRLRTNFSYMSYNGKEMLQDDFPKLSGNYNSSFYQLTKEDDFFHINGLLANYSSERNQQPIVELGSFEIDAELLSPPQLVENHLTGGKDILVQDVENNLYLISNRGKVSWKKRLSGPVLGTVKQIDMFKNGRLQLAFCTRRKLYVLDRNGNEVAPFTINFRDPITQPLAVFDYDNNRNYRLLVTQGKELLMLNARGKRVNGFKYKPAGKITSEPKHFRINRKDYIVFKSENNLRILNRRGQDRISISRSIDFSNNDIYLYQLQFTTTNKSGDLVQVDTKGQLKKQSLGLPQEHHLVTTSKTLVTQTENQLNIKLKSIDLDYGIYSPPKIFYLNDKIYVTTTDRQSKKVYLFDSQAMPINGFPLFGISGVCLNNLDVNRNLELVVQTGIKSISIFRLQ